MIPPGPYCGSSNSERGGPTKPQDLTRGTAESLDAYPTSCRTRGVRLFPSVRRRSDNELAVIPRAVCVWVGFGGRHTELLGRRKGRQYSLENPYSRPWTFQPNHLERPALCDNGG